MLPRRPLRLAVLAPLLALLLAGCATSGPQVPAGRAGLVPAEIALERADYALAARLYARAAVARHDDALAERALRIAFDHSQEHVLVELARSWLARAPRNDTARRFLVVGLLELDDRDAAERELAALLGSAFATPAEGFGAIAEAFGQLRNDTGVADVVGRLARRHPDVPEAAFAAATLALSAGDSPAAITWATHALELKPDWRAVRSLVARARVAGGDCAGGLRDSGTLAADAGDGDRLLNAWLLGACDRPAEARAAFSDLLGSRIARPEALEGLAGFDIEAQRYDDATMRLSELLASGRNADRAMYALAMVADRKGEYPRSVLLYARITSGGRAVAAQLRAYRLAIEHGQAAAATRQLDDFLGGAPEFRVEATAARAQVLADTGRLDDALALLDRASAAYPDRAEPRYARATVLEGAGRLDEALATLRAVVRTRPRDPNALNALGYTLADHERELPEAERLIRTAWAARPDSAAIRDSLGWVLHRQGRDAEALPWLQQAYRLEQDGEIATHLGLVQWALGDQSGAVRTWKSALERIPGERHLQQALASHPDPVG